MSLALTSDELQELTGYKVGSKQRKWIIDQLGLNPPMGRDGRPRLTQDVVEQAMLARKPGDVHTEPSNQPKWTK